MVIILTFFNLIKGLSIGKVEIVKEEIVIGIFKSFLWKQVFIYLK